jgi:hypothetical protein
MRRDHHSPLARISLGLGIEGSAVVLQCSAAKPSSSSTGPPPSAPTRPGRAAWTACGATRALTGRLGPDRALPGAGTRTGSSSTSAPASPTRQRAGGRATGGAGVRLVYVDRDPIVLAHANQRRAAAHDHLYLRGAVVGRDSPACQRVAVTAGSSPAGPSAVSFRRPARLSKNCATSSEAGEHAVVIAQELGPGG